MKTTPGPWHVNPDFFCDRGHGKDPAAILSADGVEVVESSEWLTLEEGDAYLMAAAPELVEALSEVIADLQFSDVPQHRNLVTMARAALAKANKA
jgi:hypothetical protein